MDLPIPAFPLHCVLCTACSTGDPGLEKAQCNYRTALEKLAD